MLLELVASNRSYIIPEWCTFVKVFLKKISVFSQNLKAPAVCGIKVVKYTFQVMHYGTDFIHQRLSP